MAKYATQLSKDSIFLTQETSDATSISADQFFPAIEFCAKGMRTDK